MSPQRKERELLRLSLAYKISLQFVVCRVQKGTSTPSDQIVQELTHGFVFVSSRFHDVELIDYQYDIVLLDPLRDSLEIDVLLAEFEEWHCVGRTYAAYELKCNPGEDSVHSGLGVE
jgi:hypothetical protein